MHSPLIGVDIGGTGIKGGIVDLCTGRLMSEPVRVSTPRPASPVMVAEALGRVVGELSAERCAPLPEAPWE